jgi:molecular chaperone GrpE
MKKEDTNTKENIEDLKHDTSEISEANSDENISDDEISEENNKKEEKKLSKEDRLKQDLETQKDKYLRLFAEFENYKRRTSKERLELFKTASQELMQVMLPVLDDFDRALKEIKKSEDDSLIHGIELIHNKFGETLKSKGLESMAVKEGDTFDADIHEAVTQIPAPDKSMKGKIVDVVEKGYTLGEKIIRYPKVVTGK